MGASMGSQVKVLINPWDSCIGCGVCEAICPEVFKVDDARGLAIINSGYTGSVPREGIVPVEFSECVERAANACPVNIIRLQPLH